MLHHLLLLLQSGRQQLHVRSLLSVLYIHKVLAIVQNCQVQALVRLKLLQVLNGHALLLEVLVVQHTLVLQGLHEFVVQRIRAVGLSFVR